MSSRSWFVVALFMAVLLPTSAGASSLTVSPIIIDRTLEARDIFEENITITNNLATPLRVFAGVHQITLNEGGGIEAFVPPSMSDLSTSVTSWIGIDRRRIELQPGESRTVTANFHVNPTAAPGLYHAFISFGAGSNRDEAEAQALAGQSEGVIIRISIEDTRVEMLRLARFAVDRFITTAGSHSLSYSLSNPGDISLTPVGEVILYNARGEEVGAIPLNSDKRTLAPGETADFTESLPPEGLFGKYKAFMTLEYGNEQRATVHDTAFFYAAPFSYLIGLFLGLFTITMGLLFFWRRKFSGYEDDDHDGYVAMYVRPEVVSDSNDHDINLKQNSQ